MPPIIIIDHIRWAGVRSFAMIPRIPQTNIGGMRSSITLSAVQSITSPTVDDVSLNMRKLNASDTTIIHAETELGISIHFPFGTAMSVLDTLQLSEKNAVAKYE